MFFYEHVNLPDWPHSGVYNSKESLLPEKAIRLFELHTYIKEYLNRLPLWKRSIKWDEHGGNGYSGSIFTPHSRGSKWGQRLNYPFPDQLKCHLLLHVYHWKDILFFKATVSFKSPVEFDHWLVMSFSFQADWIWWEDHYHTSPIQDDIKK